MEESQSAPHQGAGEPISRPNSTSAAEAAVSQLLGMTGINEGAGATSANADANEPLQEQRYGRACLAERTVTRSTYKTPCDNTWTDPLIMVR